MLYKNDVHSKSMKRPDISENNYEQILEITGFPRSAGLNFSLTEILKKYKELENFYKKHGGKKK
ncbi:MAG: hypothetical protein IIC67_08975 [Thaumarchaeota archaeon]|nr:hypothetical protein [Nitrososphaerota archaeon]